MAKFTTRAFIEAPVEKVWDTMLEDASYRKWTKVFNPGSYYKGNWEQGSKILFLGPNEDGTAEGGMVSRIKENRFHEFISIEHLGEVHDGIEDTTSERVKKWAGALENYHFEAKDGGAELTVEMDVQESEVEWMKTAWEKAILELKALAEA